MLEYLKNKYYYKSITPIEKGWSTDTKYLIIDNLDHKLLLRVNDIAKFDTKKKEFEIIQKYASIGIEMSKPIAFDTYEDKVYMILRYLEGDDLEQILPSLSVEEQYQLGYKAGKILKQIHSIKVDDVDAPRNTKIARKLEQLQAYVDSNERVENDVSVIGFVKDNIEMIWREKPCYLHGDFHPGNLIYLGNGKLGVIDFNRWEVGDPYEEFYKLQSYGVEVSIPYCCGQIDAYFDYEVPTDFWKTLAVYVAHASLFSIKWAAKFGQKDIDGMVKRYFDALSDYENFKAIIPKWYVGASYHRI